MILPYYTYSSGGVVYKALNAIATFFHSDTMGSMIKIAIMIGFLMSFAQFTTTRNHNAIIKWAVVYFFVPLGLINMTATMQIIDKTESHSYTVDNVPYIVALPTYFASTLMMGVTEGVEEIFSSVDDERYGRTGMMFGSRLYKLSRQATVLDVKTKGIFQDFFQNCIVDDIEINGKYTWSELTQTEDVFTFLNGQTMSPLRGLFVDGNNYKTCAEALPLIETRFNIESSQALNNMAARIYGSEASMYLATLATQLSNSYQTNLNVSQNQSTILKQNIALNSLRENIGALDYTGQAMNIAYTQNKMQSTAAWASIGLQAEEFVPMIHTILFMLFSCVGFIVVAVALLPNMTSMVLVNYVKGFVNLATWPMLFALINAFSTWSLQEMSTSVANTFGGLTLSNENPLDEMHMRFSAICGYLLMSVPFISNQILKGSAALMGSLNHNLAGMINSTATRTAGAVSNGDISFGNMSVDQRSFDNLSAHKHDTNVLDRTAGLATIQRSDGSMVTTRSNGGTTYDNTQTISNTTWGASFSDAAQASTQEQYRNALTTQNQTSTQLSDTISAGATLNDRWNNSLSQSLAYGSHNQTGESTQVQEGMSLMNSAINTVQKATNWSHDKAEAYVSAMGSQVSAGIKTPDGLPLPISFGASGSSSWSNEDREAYKKLDSETKTQIENATKQYVEGANVVTQAGSGYDNKETHTEIEQYAHDFGMNWQQQKSLTASANEATIRANDLSQTLSAMETQGVNYNSNLMPHFQSFIADRVEQQGSQNIKGDVERIMTSNSPEVEHTRQQLAHDFFNSDQFRALVAHPVTQQKQSVGTGSENNQDVFGMPSEQDILKAHANSQTVSFTPTQSKLMTKNADETLDRMEESRNSVLHERESTRLFNSEESNRITSAANRQSDQAKELVTQPQQSSDTGTSDLQKLVDGEVDNSRIDRMQSPATTSPYPATDYGYHPPEAKK